MGRAKMKALAPGVYKREYASGKASVQLQFYYLGYRCRENMKHCDPNKKSDVKYAINTLASIHREIERETFRYTDYFPRSKRAEKLGQGFSRRTVKEIGKSWLADMKISSPHSTYGFYKRGMNHFVYRSIGDMRVRDVTVEDIRKMFRRANITLKTARNYSIPLKAVFVRAIEDGDIDRNPMDRIILKSLIPDDQKHSDYIVDPFNPEEIDLLLATCELHRPQWVNYWTLAFFTGLRTSELYGLQWGDWDGNNLQIKRARVEGKIKRPKNEASERTVLLCPRARKALVAQRSLTAFNVDIFHNPTTKKPLTRYEPSQRCLDYCCKKAGLRRRIQYQTRHTYASNMLSMGADPQLMIKQMGHKNSLTLFRHYARWVAGKATLASLRKISYGKL